MAASADNVKYLLGDLYDALGDDKDTIIAAQIVRAQAYVDEYTNSATGTIVDNTVEDFAALYCVQRMVGGSSSANAITIGEISIGAKQINGQIEELRKQGMEKLHLIGRGSGRIMMSN